MPTVVIVRHGQASFGAANYDELSAVGHRQAKIVADGLARAGVNVTQVVSGGMARQQSTAHPIAAAFACPVTVDERWDEYDSDDILEHHSTSAVRQDRAPGSDAPAVTQREFQRVLEAAVLDWIAAGDDGPARESWPAFARRSNTALSELASALDSGETAAACTSGGVIAALCVDLLEVAATRFVDFNRVTVNAGLTRVIHGTTGLTLIAFNEQGHLMRDGLLTYR
jgi:broad specificity phosphatase PhoE